MSKKALGKDLGAIFRDAGLPLEAEAVGETIQAVSLDQIRPNPFQPRKKFDPEKIEELARSIQASGVLQPILLRRHGDHYQIVAGERRFLAARQLQFPTIPARVYGKIADRDMRTWSLVENLVREDLDPLEEAAGYEQLASANGLSHADIASAVGKSRSAVSNSLRLLQLDQRVQDMLREGKLTAGHARAILQQPAAKQYSLACRIAAGKSTVREAEDLGKKRPKKSDQPDPDLARFLEKLRYALGGRVSLRGDQRSGTLQVHFSSQAQLERLGDIILRGAREGG